MVLLRLPPVLHLSDTQIVSRRETPSIASSGLLYNVTKTELMSSGVEETGYLVDFILAAYYSDTLFIFIRSIL